TGAKIWNTTLNEPMYSGLCDIADHGKVATLTAFGRYVCYDMATGKKLWTSDTMDYPWSSAGFGGYTAFSAYGFILREAYDGIYAFNWTTGKIAWHYVAPAGAVYETPYTNGNGTTVMPFYSFGVGGQIADGKFFTWNYEHTESWPVTRGWSLHAIDVFTGKGVWNLTGCSTPRAIADGYLVATGWVDGYTYIIGKGKSATTVTAPDTEIALGQSVMIKGSVMDLSPAQPNTPCVSVDSMKTQMDYLHMQLPLGGLFGKDTMTGVPVYVYAVDPNNNYKDIGIATTNAYYGTFSIPFTPEVEGTYTIMASFGGDASYGSSGAATAITVGPAPTAAPTPIPPEKPIDYMPMMYAILACVIIAIIISLIALFRKR
ncbi:PQQ-binding-like beta-propeller repeat protein, partial [Candidatus Bathyarchaeota archaeon]|nr:PQQ-binding-like beta-propeller repeat protein [Candidatus Bathyarchaeota archaeon]